MKWKSLSSRAMAVALSLSLTAFGTFAVWKASRALNSAEREVRGEQEFRFETRRLVGVANSDFEVISSPAVFLQTARFQDHLFMAGPAGLLEYDPGGTLLRQYAVGRELPGSPLLAISSAVLADSHEQELIVATATDGIVAFNGRTFRQIFADDSSAREITAMLPLPSGRLLIGTRRRGVLVYDGKRITFLHPTLKNLYVTALAGDQSDLWIGTLNSGVLHLHAAESETFSEAKGMPDPQVTSIAVHRDIVYVGTPLGVAVFDRGRFSRVLAPGIFATALLPTESQLWVGTEDQGVISIALAERRTSSGWGDSPELAEVEQLFPSGDSIFAVARGGLYELSPHALEWKRVLHATSATLTDRNISALAADAKGQLWIGYFDRGLDILATDNGRVTHVEDQHVFCVNRIFLDAKAVTIDVATANGLVRFDDFGAEKQVLTRSDGIIADHITDVVAYQDGLALATPAGLTFLDGSGARSIYAFQGLVNNHVYALAVSGDQLMAGTLGGLSVLDNGNIAINYTTTSSDLKHNWITAVVPIGSEWMVGTYGAGIFRLDGAGHFHSYEKASGAFEVNPNAMLVTPNYVLAGTLGKGLYLYDRQSERWSVVEQGLPSNNVTALAAGNGYIYVGTDNGLVRIPEQKLRS